MPQRAARALPSVPELAASIAAEVRRRRGAPRRALPKVPAAVRDAVDDALRSTGLEVTRSAVRLPARGQLLEQLEEQRAIDEKGVVARLACVTGPEAKEVILSLVREGRVRRVERRSGAALVLASEPAIDAARAKQIAGELERALKWIRRGAKGALLARDVAEMAEELGRLTGPAARERVTTDARPPPPTASLLDRLARTATELAALHGGLAPVPGLVRALGDPTASVHAALREGHARGWLELQPESSMGRLSAEDLALCLPGPEGTRLSWVRPLAGAHSS